MPKLSPPRWIGLFCIYLAIATILTFPLIADLSGRIIGFEYGDGYETTHHVAWFTEALRTGRSPFIASELGYPNGIDGVTLWAHPLQTFPAWGLAFFTGAPAAVNLAALLTLALNGLCMCALVRHLTRSAAAGVVAGMAFMLFPTIQGHLGAGHSGMIVQWTLALYALAALRLRDRTALAVWAGRIGLAAALFVVSAWGHTLQIVYATIPLTALLLLTWALGGEWIAVRRLAIAAAIGSVALSLFLIPVARSALTDPAYIDVGGGVRYSADLLAPVTPSFLHPVYGALLDYPARVLGVNLDEGAAYVGIVGGVLAAIGIVRRRESRMWAALAAIAFVLSLGAILKIFDIPVTFESDGIVSHVTLPFAALVNLPGAALLRTPARFNLGLALAISVLIGYGTAAILSAPILRRRLTRAAFVAVLTAAIAFDYATFGFGQFPTTPAIRPDGVIALRARADVRAVFDVPYDSLIVSKRGLYLHTLHGLPLIAGQVTRQTPVDPAKLAILQAALDPAALHAAGADVVIVHRREDADGALYARAGLRLGAPTYQDETVALFAVPPTDTVPEFRVLVPASSAIETRLPVYLYAPTATGALLTMAVSAPDGIRDLLLLDDAGAALGRYTIDGAADVIVFVGLDAGYSTIMLTADPPCLTPPSATLTCRRLVVTGLTLAPG